MHVHWVFSLRFAVFFFGTFELISADTDTQKIRKIRSHSYPEILKATEREREIELFHIDMIDM